MVVLVPVVPGARAAIVYQASVANVPQREAQQGVQADTFANASIMAKLMFVDQRRAMEAVALETAPVRVTFVLVGTAVHVRQVHTVKVATAATTISVQAG